MRGKTGLPEPVTLETVGACIEVNDEGEGFGASLDCLEGLLYLLRDKAPKLGDLQSILEVALLVAYPLDDHRRNPSKT